MKSKDSKVNILMFNVGSSSLKYRLISMPSEEELVAGEAERVGVKTSESATITHSVLGKKRVIKLDLPDHAVTFRKVMELLKEDRKENKNIIFDAFAHRYVHPGNFFSKTTFVTKSVLKKLGQTLELAPIHNPVSYKLIQICAKEMPNVPQLAIFDTAFHSTIPKDLSTYALPRKIAKKYGLKRVGFHGISYEYSMQEAARLVGKPASNLRMISCHLSPGGSSVCAIDCGKSINNSMGFTPLEGLMMNTRSGDLDLGLIFYIMFKENFSAEETENALNKKSGILGVFKSSSDLRDVIKNADTDPAAKMALNMYIKRVKKYVGFYGLLLKKPDVIVFTDKIGMNFPLVREKVCEGFDIFGIRLDKNKNESYSGGLKDISAEDSQAKIIIVPINEELMIARQAYKEYCHDNSN
jgi:acetate kinase